MYTCRELTHSPSGGYLGGPAGRWPASRLQKREAAISGRFMQVLMGKDVLRQCGQGGPPLW